MALAFFAALRPSEIRGLTWEDYDAASQYLHIRRSVWRRHIGDTKTEGSAKSVFVIEPLKGLLTKIGDLYGRRGYILQNAKHEPLDLNHLNLRTITPALDGKVGWRGYYPGRRGLSTKSSDVANPIVASGLLRHTNPATTLRHYTQAQKKEMEAAMKEIEILALKLTSASAP